MKKIWNILFCAAFLLMLLIPLCLTDFRTDVVSEIDNRRLTEFPVLGEGDFSEGMEDYVSDRIGGRNLMIRAYAQLNDKLFHELTHPTYTYGQDGYIFFNMHDNIPYGDYHRTYAEMVAKLQEYCQERGIRFYFLFEPEKISVYRRYLPEGVNYEDEWVDTMLDYMDQLGVNCMDNTEVLIQRSQTEQVFNRQYDAGHWNELGCFYGTNTLLARIHEDIPEVTELTMDLFDITTDVAATLPNSEFVVNEEIPRFHTKTPYENIADAYRSELDQNPSYPYFHYLVNQSEGAEELPRMLVFQGSYYNSRPQYLINDASEYIAIHNYQNVLNIDEYCNIFQPDVVILEVAEYTLMDRYFDSAVMAAMDLNPALADTALPLEEQVTAALADTVQLPETTELSVEDGSAIDRAVLDRLFPESRYGWLVSDTGIYDLRRNEDGYYEACVNRGALDGDVTLVVEEMDGSRYRIPLTVTHWEDIELTSDGQ